MRQLALALVMSSDEYAFHDGSVRYYKFGASLTLENLWAMTDYYRTNTCIMIK
jgi:hypothetical protein